VITNRQRKLILLAEAGSAVSQCTAILGDDRTRRIQAELDTARDEVMQESDE
jgi:hypothetical protein